MTFDREDMEELEPRLKPCPMCGSPAKFIGKYTTTGKVSSCYIRCTGRRPCMRTMGTWTDPFKAFLVWNTRTEEGEE